MVSKPMEIEAARLISEVWHPTTEIENRKSKIENPAWAVWVGAGVLALYLALLPFIERTWRITGDEPHYLLAAHSLVYDWDFDLTNNYARLDYLNFYFSKDITPQARLSPAGQQILDHQLGLVVLIAPAYALSGRLGVLGFQAILAGLLAGLTFKLAVLVSQDEPAALLATLFVALSPPLLMYNYLVYPELIGALLTTLVLYFALRHNQATPTAFSLTLLALITLPWLNRRFVPLAILLALLLAWAWRERSESWKVGKLEGRKVGKLIAPPSVLLLVTVMFSIGLLWVFENQLVRVGEPDITAPTINSIFWDRLGRGLVGWLVDQQRGLFIYAPIYIFALWGLPFMISDSLRRRNRSWFVMLPFLLSLGVTTLAGGFWIAWELGPRFLVAALPALAPVLAVAWRSYSRQKIWRVVAVLLFGLSLSNTLVILQNPELPYKSSLPLYYGDKFGLSLTEWLPDLAGYFTISPAPPTDPTSAQVVSENGDTIWFAERDSSVRLVQSGPLTKLPFGHYRLTWPLRVEAGLSPPTELLHLSLKLSGGGQVFNRVITAADLPADGSYGLLQFSWRNPNVDRWRTPLVFNAVSSGESRIWAKKLLFAPDPFYAVFLAYLCLSLMGGAALLSWYYHSRLLPSAIEIRAEPLAENQHSHGPAPFLIEKYWGLALILPLAAWGYIVYQHQQSSHTYEAGELNHFVGQAVNDPQAGDGQAWLVDPQVDPPQKAVYGPFDIYDPGRYQVTFRLKLPETVETDQELARLQVAATANFDELITQPLRREHFSKPNLYHDFVLTLTNPRRQALSFEVYYLGAAPLLLDQVIITQVSE
jgi:hypothetical protein